MNRGIRKEKGILLVHPPAAKACEAPGGLARLAGALRRHGVACRVWDANVEGQIALLTSAGAQNEVSDRVTALDRRVGEGKQSSCGGSADLSRIMEAAPRGRERGDRWTRRASRHLTENMALLRSREGYRNPDRYRRLVADVNRILATAARPAGVRLSLADYEDERLSPVRSTDLLCAAAGPELNPFYPWFRERLPAVLAETTGTHVGFSLNFLSQALTTFAMIGFLRRAFPEVRIVLGGGLVTSWLRRPGWKNPFGGLVDELIAGPGEAPLLALLGKEHDGRPNRPDLDGFPLADYLAPGTILPYSASSGCWWRRCSFCPERAEGNPYRPLAPGRVVEDLRALTVQAKPALIHFLDNAMSPALLKALAEEPPSVTGAVYACARKWPSRTMPALASANSGTIT